MVFRIAEKLVKIAAKLEVPLVFKASFDKANRSSSKSFRGIGKVKALEVLSEVREKFNVPVLTDVHTEQDAIEAGAVVDVLQIPAFLCRQTDLLRAAAYTGKVVNVKKGQFLSPNDMKNVAQKLESAGTTSIMLTERGTTFGYNNLVVDMRGIPIMQETGYPVIMDATHAVQHPGGAGDRSSGESRFAPVLARAAVAVGCDGVFIETHMDPSKALSDGPNMIPLSAMPKLMAQLKELHEMV